MSPVAYIFAFARMLCNKPRDKILLVGAKGNSNLDKPLRIQFAADRLISQLSTVASNNIVWSNGVDHFP